MATLQQIREAIVQDLGLGHINQHGVCVDTDTIGIAGLRDILGDTDNRILEGAYFMLKNNIHGSFSQSTVLNGDITASATSLTVTQNASATFLIRVGDIISLDDGSLNDYTLVTDISYTDATNLVCTVVRGVLGATAVAHVSGGTVGYNSNRQWRAISSHSYSTDRIELVRAIQGLATQPILFDVYFILTPKELNDCINQALTKLWFKDKVSITLADDDNYYDITSSASWLTDSTQIMSLDYRYTSDSVIREWPSNHRKFEVTDDNVSVILYDIPSTVTGYSLYVTGRHWYEALTHDGDTTTCPLPLIRAQAKVEVLQKIFNKLGPAAKQNYGQEMVLADAECERMRSRYRQAIIPIDLSLDEPWEGPEVPVKDGQYEW